MCRFVIDSFLMSLLQVLAHGRFIVGSIFMVDNKLWPYKWCDIELQFKIFEGKACKLCDVKFKNLRN